ncbi:MAG: type IV pilus twitching motility protein PilT [Bradymonadia bacterium]
MRLMLDQQASSLLLQTLQPPALFIGNRFRPLSEPALESDDLQAVLECLLGDDRQWQLLKKTGELKVSYRVPHMGRFTVQIQRSREGWSVVVRPSKESRNATPPPKVATPKPVSDRRGISLHQLLEQSVEQGASDVVIAAGESTTLRIMGKMIPVPEVIFEEQDLMQLLKDAFTPERRATFDETGSVDLALEFNSRITRKACRFRVNVFKQLRGISAVFRWIWDVVPDFRRLNIPRDVPVLTELPHGLILVCGPTGSGKSTTLAALVEHINQRYPKHIITLEDPIEYRFKGKRSLIQQRELGIHVKSYAHGLRSALREAPDIILLGEMRDLSTMSAALTAAETGHLVLSTLHSGSAYQAVERMVNAFPESQQGQARTQIAEVLRAVITQRLVPSADGRRRLPVVEMMRVNYAISNLIREGKTHLMVSQLQTGRQEGMLPFDVSLAEMVATGMVDLDEAMRVAQDPKSLEQLLQMTPAPGG